MLLLLLLLLLLLQHPHHHRRRLARSMRLGRRSLPSSPSPSSSSCPTLLHRHPSLPASLPPSPHHAREIQAAVAPAGGESDLVPYPSYPSGGLQVVVGLHGAATHPGVGQGLLGREAGAGVDVEEVDEEVLCP
jgi:hypothetical protein